MVKVSSQQTVSNINKFYLNDKLHLLFKEDEINGVQSWIENDNKFVIEISMKEGESLIAEYDKREVWIEMLSHIDKLIY